MQQDSGGYGRRGAALGLALLAHALILWALLQVRAPLPHGAPLERLTLIYLPPPAPAVADHAMPVAPAAPRRATRPPSPVVSAPITPDVAGTAHPNVPSLPPIDWLAEQQQAAGSQAQEIWKHLSQHCRDAFALHIYPPECHRYVPPEPWEPEEKRFGLAGPLPYIRLGQCVVGLGFWGCAVGKPPPPNGRVFDGMRDPDRPGSVPGNGSYQAPPEPRERLH